MVRFWFSLVRLALLGAALLLAAVLGLGDCTLAVPAPPVPEPVEAPAAPVEEEPATEAATEDPPEVIAIPMFPVAQNRKGARKRARAR